MEYLKRANYPDSHQVVIKVADALAHSHHALSVRFFRRGKRAHIKSLLEYITHPKIIATVLAQFGQYCQNGAQI